MAEPTIKKKESILIQVVDNGFIVKEDFPEFPDMRRSSPEVMKRKVFNTKKSLFNYISENL